VIVLRAVLCTSLFWNARCSCLFLPISVFFQLTTNSSALFPHSLASQGRQYEKSRECLRIVLCVVCPRSSTGISANGRLLKYNEGDSGIKIPVLYWRCSSIKVSVMRGSSVIHPCLRVNTTLYLIETTNKTKNIINKKVGCK
jgi:hypothetical protein